MPVKRFTRRANWCRTRSGTASRGRPVDVMQSNVDCTLEDLEHQLAVRLGLRLLQRLKSESADRIFAARAERGRDR